MPAGATQVGEGTHGTSGIFGINSKHAHERLLIDVAAAHHAHATFFPVSVSLSVRR